jgi:hypothetical protein
MDYGPGVGLASIVFPSILYIGGLYSPRYLSADKLRNARWIVIGLLAMVAVALASGSIVFTARIGRGVMFWSVLFLVPMLVVRHWLVVGRRMRRVQSMLCLVGGDSDEQAAVKLYRFWGSRPQFRDRSGAWLSVGFGPSRGGPGRGFEERGASGVL